MTQLNLKDYGIEKTKDGEYESKKFAANLKAEDLGKPGKTEAALIKAVQEREFDVAEGKKVILTLEIPGLGDDDEARMRQLSLNKTNLIAVVSGLGEDTKNWLNAAIMLKVEKTMYQGKTVPCIRVDAQQ